ncbi:MAG: ribosome silencing factor [Proteobacteria bacterium]|nr:ribosome silencing factor [Pseudomonadota bacterium]
MPAKVLKIIEESLDDDKAMDVVVIDLTGKSSIADFMVIASGQSSRHVSAMTEHLLSVLKDNKLKGATIEGQERGDWVLVDAGDVIVHLFRPEVRDFYNLEKLWSFEMPEMAESTHGSVDRAAAAHTA